MKSTNESTPIRKLTILGFIISMTLTISLIGALIFFNWYASARETTGSIAANAGASIHNQISSFMHAPYHVNEVNHLHLESNYFELSDEAARDRFFVGVLEAHEKNIYSFSLGTVEGEYYGARRNDEDIIEIMRNNETTGGESWYYAVNNDYTAGERVVQAGLFDARTRAWYKAAAESGAPSFSPVYKHFIKEDLTISAAWPLYDDNGRLTGVMGTHMLLGEIGEQLAITVGEFGGKAIIVEKDTGLLIANSMGLENYAVTPEGTYSQRSIDDTVNGSLQVAYNQYQETQTQQFVVPSPEGNQHLYAQEFSAEGIHWVILTAIPENLLMGRVNDSIKFTLALALVLLIVSLIASVRFTDKLLKPLDQLLKVSEKMAMGDLTQRVAVTRQDEIGRISHSFNKVADKMRYLITNLETLVQERTSQLNQAKLNLEESNDKLQLILDSSAEAIYGINLEGRCTFCNESSLKLLGYHSQEELIGELMHEKIHHTHPDSTPFLLQDCSIYQSVVTGEGVTVEDEVFWKKDGAPIEVEYSAYPQIHRGKIVGAVITFADITDRKSKEKRINYLTYHDSITGLLNRSGFENAVKSQNTEENLPLSIIFADINGLKLTNDIFGHAAGDSLIKKSGQIIINSCRDNDVIARVGGDEFVILLPNTSQNNAVMVMERIRSCFSQTCVEAIKCSISLGSDSKTNKEQSFEDVLANAENMMYKDKTSNHRTVNQNMLGGIIKELHRASPADRGHAERVSVMAAELGLALNLPKSDISRLKRASYLHDIGNITLDSDLLAKEFLAEEEREAIKQHTAAGYRLLNMFDDTVGLAEFVYSHHEHWDGSGYPRCLKGESIPLLSRIISLVEVYDRLVHQGNEPLEERKSKALAEIREGAGIWFDPHIVEVFINTQKGTPVS